MLGMMNSPTDGVEFYAVNKQREMEGSGLSEVDKKTFVDAKQKPCVTYTADGRKLIGGKSQESEESTANSLWGAVLLRSAVRKGLEEDEEGKTTTEEIETEDKEKTPQIQPVQEEEFGESTA